MNEIKIYLKASGSIAMLDKDFSLYQGSYRNVQITMYVPKILLYQDLNGVYQNAVKTGAILITPSGAKVTTLSYPADYVKTITVNGVEYAVYTQTMPKEFTLYAGTQTIVCNVVSIDSSNASSPKIISITTTQEAQLLVLESAYLDSDVPLDPSESEIIEALINGLRVQLDYGYFGARSLYAWNSEYTYGANEIVFYPDKGEYGTFVKSLINNNDNAPYVDSSLNSDYWEEITDFNILNELYTLKSDTQEALAQAQANANAAEQSANASEASAESAREYFEQAQAQAEAAAGSANTAENWAEVARGFAEFGIKINMDYSSLEELPQPGDSRYIYLIPNGGETGNGDNTYDEFIWVDDKNAYEKIGTTDIDLSAYETKVEHNESIEVVNTAIAAVSDALSSETTSREDADSELREELDTKADTDGDYPDMSVGKATNADSATNADNAEVAAKLGTATKGSSVIPIYLSNGTPTQCSRTIPVIHLNGEDVSLSPTFYAPTSHGNSGDILRSNGNAGTPGWVGATPYSTSNLTNGTDVCDTVVKYYRNAAGTKWWRIWKSGWKEQGEIITINSSIAAGGNSDQSVTFDTNFVSANYIVSATASYGANSPTTKTITGEEISIIGKTTSGMTIHYHNRNSDTTNANSLQIEYYCCGY